MLGWVAIAFSRGSSQPRGWTRFSCTVSRFFTVWATREALMRWGCHYKYLKKMRIANRDFLLGEDKYYFLKFSFSYVCVYIHIYICMYVCMYMHGYSALSCDWKCFFFRMWQDVLHSHYFVRWPKYNYKIHKPQSDCTKTDAYAHMYTHTHTHTQKLTAFPQSLTLAIWTKPS